LPKFIIEVKFCQDPILTLAGNDGIFLSAFFWINDAPWAAKQAKRGALFFVRGNFIHADWDRRATSFL
jgi:hypothetical protein